MQLEELDRLTLQNYWLKAQLIINQIGQENFNEIARLKNKEAECLKKVCKKMKLDPLKIIPNYETGEIVEVENANNQPK